MDNFFREIFLLVIKAVVSFAIAGVYLAIRTSLIGDTGQLPLEESLIVFIVSIIIGCLIVNIFTVKR